MMRIFLILSVLLSVLPAIAVAQGDLPPEQEALARRLLNAQGCKACHRFEGGTTEVGPGLREVSRGLNRAALERSLVNPEHRHAKGLIPDFSHLQAQEIDALVDFLHNLPAAAD